MRLKSLILIAVALAAFSCARCQLATPNALGVVNLASVSPGNARTLGASTLPVCSPNNYQCNTPASFTYIFNGSGNWTVPENWLNNIVPPAELTHNYEIVIDPTATFECILNVPQTIDSGAKLTIKTNKKLVVAGGVVIQ